MGKSSINGSFSMAMLNNQMVYIDSLFPICPCASHLGIFRDTAKARSRMSCNKNAAGGLGLVQVFPGRFQTHGFTWPCPNAATKIKYPRISFSGEFSYSSHSACASGWFPAGVPFHGLSPSLIILLKMLIDPGTQGQGMSRSFINLSD